MACNLHAQEDVEDNAQLCSHEEEGEEKAECSIPSAEARTYSGSKNCPNVWLFCKD